MQVANQQQRLQPVGGDVPTVAQHPQIPASGWSPDAAEQKRSASYITGPRVPLNIHPWQRRFETSLLWQKISNLRGECTIHVKATHHELCLMSHMMQSSLWSAGKLTGDQSNIVHRDRLSTTVRLQPADCGITLLITILWKRNAVA